LKKTLNVVQTNPKNYEKFKETFDWEKVKKISLQKLFENSSKII
jgi:hypothetical protein